MKKSVLYDIFAVTAILIVLYTFMFAYQSPEKMWGAAINQYGEAEIELILILIGAIIVISTFWKKYLK